jgi:16S rRNA (guanine527-N7)-methyltransferase
MAARGEPMTPNGFAALTGIPLETLERLTVYADLVAKWQKAINLVGRGTLEDPWRRHMLDSAQLAPMVPRDAKRVLDLGSGAGFPGMVLAIMGVAGIELVESDQKKAMFLREVARATGAEVAVHVRRIEDMPAENADVVTARALAPLDRLLPLVMRFVGPQTLCLFPKGADVERELAAAARSWHMCYTRHTSLSDTRSTVLAINKLWADRHK